VITHLAVGRGQLLDAIAHFLSRLFVRIMCQVPERYGEVLKVFELFRIDSARFEGVDERTNLFLVLESVGHLSPHQKRNEADRISIRLTEFLYNACGRKR